MRIIPLIMTCLALAACGWQSAETYVAEAKTHIASGDYAAAGIELKNALQEDSDFAEARWLLGTVLLETGEILSSEEQLLRARELGWPADDIRPALAKTLLGRGKVEDVLALEYDDLGKEAAARLLSTQAMAALADQQNDRARELADLAQARAPQLHAVKLARATLLVRQGEPDAALELVENLEREAPNDSGAQWLKGQILLLQGDLAAAREAIDRSIAASADTALIDHIMRALVSVQLKDYAAAMGDAAIVLEHNAKDPTANYIVGVNHFHNGEFRNAIAALGLARPVAPQFPLVLYYLGSSYLIEREVELAETFAEKFHGLVPDNANGRKLLAAIKLLGDRPDVARDLLQPVLDQNPGDVQALNFMANALLVEGQADIGMLMYAQISRLQPDWQVVPLPLGDALVWSDPERDSARPVQGWADDTDNFPQTHILTILNNLARRDYPAAIETAESLHYRDPGNTASLNVLGRVYFAAGRNEDARDAFERALKRDPGNPSANWSLAEMALAAGDADAARDYYRTVLKHEPQNLTTLLKLAELEAASGNTRARIATLEQAVRGNPHALEPRLLLAEYHLGGGNSQDIEPLFAELSALQRRSPRVLELTALGRLAAGQYEAARATLERWIEEDPTSAQAHYLLALAANATGDGATRRRALLAALERDPAHVPALLSLAKLARIEGDRQRFDQYLAALVDVAPEAPEVLRLRALAAQADGEQAQALALSQRAFELAPTTRSALELASMQLAADDGEAARKTLQEWVDEHPQDIDARLFLANHLLQRADTAGAQAQYRAVLELDGDNITALNNLAWTLRTQDPRKALKYSRRAATLAPDSPQLLDTLAVIELLNGKHLSAQRNIRRALQSQPDNPTLRYHDAMITAALGNEEKAIAALEALLSATDANFTGRAEAEALLRKLRG